MCNTGFVEVLDKLEVARGVLEDQPKPGSDGADRNHKQTSDDQILRGRVDGPRECSKTWKADNTIA